MLNTIADNLDTFLGFGEPYPKADIVNFISGTTGQSKSTWNNKSDAIYYSYHRAIKEKGYKPWQPSDPTGSENTVKFVTAETGLSRNDVYQYLLTLYTMANMGKLKTEYWNPGGNFGAYGAAQITEGIKQFISPVTQTAAAPARRLITGLLVAGGLTAIGIFASKQAIKTGLRGRQRK